MCKANQEIDEISIAKFFEVIAFGEADPLDTIGLAYLERDDRWLRDEAVRPKGEHLAWAVYVDFGVNEADGFSSPGELYRLMCFPEGFL